MRRILRGGNRRLLYRSYLILAGGLLVVAVVLDFGFRLLQAREPADRNPWLEATFGLIEGRLASVPADERERVAAAIGTELGFDVRLLGPDDVYAGDVTEHSLAPLVDGDGNTSYLHGADSIDAIIRLGPIDAPQTSPLLRLLPPLFYLSIFIVVGIWLRPLLRDVDVISNAVQRFAADYREPLATAEQTSELKPLAGHLDEMAARLSGVLRSQKELIAALSHEMRTPLARLRFAIALGRDAADDEFKQKLAAMNDDVQAIDELIASMLNYARLDHPDIEMRRQSVPSIPWLERILGKSAASPIAIELKTEGCPDTVSIDPRLMELALSNLIVNALKYAQERVRCALAAGPAGYSLSVEDDGPGIPEDHRETVFRAFTRIDDSRNRDTGGSGLGLAVVARVAELHGGSAEVSSSPDLKGARFSIRWPRA